MSFAGARNALTMASVALDGLDFIELLTHVGGDKAEAALKLARSTITALKEGFAGKTDPQLVLAQIQAMHEAIRIDDAAADQALHDKFHPDDK